MSVVIRAALLSALSLYCFQFKFLWISSPKYLYECTCSNGLCPKLNTVFFLGFLPCSTIFYLELLKVHRHFSPYSVITLRHVAIFISSFVRTTMSSAYSKQFTLALPHWIPVFVLFICLISSLKNNANNIGDNTPPCFTPNVVKNASDIFLLSLILLVVWL